MCADIRTRQKRARGALALILATVASATAAFGQTAAGGVAHTVILKSDGTVWTVGANSSGQLGDSTNTPRTTPVQVSGLSDVVAIAAGYNHSMAITSTGALYLWGANANGQLGDGSTTARNAPVQSSLTNVVAIAGGRTHSLALRSNGDIYAWGTNDYGQFGNGSSSSSAQTSPVLTVTSGAAVAAGGYHSVFVKSDGTVYASGYNGYGALGDGSTTLRTSPVQMSGISTAVAAAAGEYHSLILLSDGTVKGAGYNGTGELGDGTNTGRSTAVATSGLTGVAGIAAGHWHSVAVKTDGTVRAWGWSAYGQVGDGTSTSRNTPTSVSGLGSIATVGAGVEHTVAVSSSGVVYTWGRNISSQLGDGTTVNRKSPVAISEAGFDWKVSTPTFSVLGGTYDSDRTVAISITTTGATIHYTQNGNEPTTSDSTIASGSSVTVSASQTLKAKAFKTGMPASTTTSETYTMKVAAIGYSPGATTYTSAQNVTMTTATPGVTIRYTTDGNTPTASSTAYTGAISIATSTVLKAVGFKSGYTDSDVASGTYTMNFGTLATPAADQATGTYVSGVTVSLSSISGATIRYTTNNTAVQTNSTVYTAPLAFDVTTTLRFKAFHPDYAASSEVTRTYTITPAAPVFNPTAGNYVGGQDVTVTAATSGSTIHYTINSVEPTTSDPAITSGSTLVVGNYTLKAKAFKTGTTASATTTAAYTISGTVTPPALAAGKDHSLAIRSDGVAWGWGSNASGELGIGASTTDKLLPVVISGLNGGVAIDAGGNYSHALKDDGTLVGFGDNTNGRIGDGTTTVRYLPTAVSSLTAVVAVSSGTDHSVALKGDGAVYAWGNNFYGQVGDGGTTTRTSPTLITGISSVSAVSAGENFSVALEQDGSMSSWGRNNSGQLGNGSTTNSSSPVSVSSITTATAVSAGFQHALALLTDGTVRAWGNNTWGQIGDGYSGSQYNRTSPVTVAGLDDVVAIAAGTSFSMALKDDGTVWTWGGNSHGELGDGSTTDRSSPAQIAGLSDIVQIAAGSSHALAMTSDGTVYAWGRNVDGQLGDGTTTNRLSPVEISGPGMNWRVPTPTLSLASGLYSADQTVTVTIPDPDATLRYTTTGVDPTSSDATVTSGGTISVQQSQTLKVSGWRTGAVTSLVVARTYELKAVTPVLTPGSGAYGSSQSVSMSTTTGGSTIRYTTDGTEPTSSSTTYASAITVPDTQTVKAKAFKTGWTTSDSGHASYWISSGTVAPPSITPSGGAQTSPPLVAITTTTSGATIRYTLDGSTPTAASAVFVYPFLVNATTTVKAKAFKANYASSAVASTTYDVDASGAAATPTIVPAGGWFATQQTVTISGASGATLRYTTDGTDPTTSSTTITSGNTITVAKSQIVKVRAWASGVDPSAIRRADFVVIGTVSAGVSHSAALAANGTVWTWGSNFYYQLGQSPSVQQSTTPVQALSGATALSAGAHHTMALKADGTVWSWGRATNGRLGNGSATGEVSTPAQITFTNAVAIAAGYAHSLVLKADGTVWAFGKNEFGELGDGSTTQRTTAVQVTGLTGVIAIAAGRDSSYALQSDGAGSGIVWAWGNNQSGQLGDGSTLPRLTPVRVLGVSSSATALAASTSASFAFAIGSDGKIYGWGENTLRQLGLGHSTDQATAVALPVITAARLVTAALANGLAVDATARSWAWGDTGSGALALGWLGYASGSAIPQKSDIGGVLHLAAADAHTLAMLPNGTVKAYGLNNSGQLGDGTTTASLDGVLVSSLSLADNTFLAGDQDADDLATWREYLFGTDPLNPDTNGNGILDGHDDASGANALDPDADDDGVPNWVEQKNGTDPFNADTDGDSVSDANDAFPLDPTRSMAPSSNPSDTTPPVVTLKEPVSAQLIP